MWMTLYPEEHNRLVKGVACLGMAEKCYFSLHQVMVLSVFLSLFLSCVDWCLQPAHIHGFSNKCTDFQTLTLQLDHHKSTDEQLLGTTTSSLSASTGDLLLQPSPKHKAKTNGWAWIDLKVAFKIFLVIASGCLSSVPFEMIMRRDRGSGMFAAFFLHIYTVSIGFPRANRDGYLIQSKMIHFQIII